MKHFFQSMLVVIATLVILYLAWQLREALVLFLLSLAVAASARGPVNILIKRGFPRGLATVLVYLLGLTFLVVVLYLASGSVLRDLQRATDEFDRFYKQATTRWPNGTLFQQMVAKQLPPPQALYDAITGERGTELLENFLGVATVFMEDLTKFFIVLVLSLYWSFDRLHFERIWISLLPAERRRRAREVWRRVEEGVGGYIQSELVQSIMAGVLLGIGYYVIGLNFPALIALVGALLWLVPWLGAVLALILPLLIGLNQGITMAVAAVIYTAVILAFLELVVEPRMFERRKYSSLLVVVVLVAMAEEFGLLGLLLAPPLAAAIQVLFTSLMQSPSPRQEADAAIKVHTLRKRLKKLQAEISSKEEKPTPEVSNLLARLGNLIEQADLYLDIDGYPATRIK